MMCAAEIACRRGCRSTAIPGVAEPGGKASSVLSQASGRVLGACHGTRGPGAMLKFIMSVASEQHSANRGTHCSL